jgi:hypothetical protein
MRLVLTAPSRKAANHVRISSRDEAGGALDFEAHSAPDEHKCCAYQAMLARNAPMDLYKLAIAADAPPQARETTTNAGPFIVAAREVGHARLLLAINFSIAALRRLGAAAPTGVWSDAGPHEFVKLAGLEEEKLRQKLVVAGTDISHWYLDRAVLKDGRKILARMVWWPCREGDCCPV